MPEPKVISIGGQSMPLDIDNLTEDAYKLGTSLAPVEFAFTFAGVRFACRSEKIDDKNAVLRVAGDLGPLPFSAESPAARLAVLTIVEDANAALGTLLKLTHGRIMVGGDRPLSAPITAATMVTAIATFMLPIRPYLELLSEVVRPPMLAHKAGESPLRPEWRGRPVMGRRW
jgi:hypothetical protein